jgi:hypothetical protein
MRIDEPAPSLSLEIAMLSLITFRAIETLGALMYVITI